MSVGMSLKSMWSMRYLVIDNLFVTYKYVNLGTLSTYLFIPIGIGTYV